MDEKNRYEAKLAGKDYVIVGYQTKAHMDAVVALVNMQLEQLNELDPELSLIDRAVLMTVNAVSKQILQEDRIMTLEQQIKEFKETQPSYHNKGFSGISQPEAE